MKPKVTIRPMVASDLAAICAIEAAAQPSPWTAAQFLAELAAAHARCSVARVEGEVAGFLVGWQLGDEFEIQNLATAPDRRRCGVARALIEAALSRARRDGAARALLEVRVGNLPAIALYRRFGFREDGRRFRYYPDGEDALLLSCPLVLAGG